MIRKSVILVILSILYFSKADNSQIISNSSKVILGNARLTFNDTLRDLYMRDHENFKEKTRTRAFVERKCNNWSTNDSRTLKRPTKNLF